MKAADDAETAAQDCDCDDAIGDVSDTYSFARRAYNADDLDETQDYARRAMRAADDAEAALSDCDDNEEKEEK